MPMYRVILSGTMEVVLEAENEDEASEMANFDGVEIVWDEEDIYEEPL